jgi:hypothetical protein
MLICGHTTFCKGLLAGEILDMIEDMNRVAKIGFDGRAEIASQFNKDLILRASRKIKGNELGTVRKSGNDPK